MSNLLCLIPARSGSKGIKNKNIKLIKEKPLISYSILYAKNSKIKMDIIVSTESQEFKEIAIKYGAFVPFMRPKELSRDETPDYPVCLHGLESCEKIYHKNYDYVIWLRPTSPIRPKNLIQDGLKILNANLKVDSVRTVSLSKQHPLRQFYISGGILKPVSNSELIEPFNQPRQMFNKAYFQTGHMEIIRSSIIKNGSISGNKIAPLIIDNEYLFDLDTQADLDFMLYKIKEKPYLLD